MASAVESPTTTTRTGRGGTGGNVEGAKAGEVVTVNGVKIVGHANVAGRLAASSSALYAKNLLTFLETMIDKKEKKLAVNWDDEIIKGCLIVHEGELRSEMLKKARAQG